ncbi:MAG: DUF3291 domain-containing protein [Ferruginibacter sp.]
MKYKKPLKFSAAFSCPNSIDIIDNMSLTCAGMEVSLTIIRYPRKYIFFAFLAMAIHRLPLYFNKTIHFYKLLGCGRNGALDKIPDFQQWGVLAVHKPGPVLNLNKPYGSFISSWLRIFNCEVWTVFLKPFEGHGSWDGKLVFGELPNHSDHEGMIAILTRATIRLNKLKHFWRHIEPVSTVMKAAPGFITSVGIGEIPWIKQATFSVWESKESMKAFAYGMKVHTDVIKMTRDENWYSEEMFVRFKITGCTGSLRGINPLQGKY